MHIKFTVVTTRKSPHDLVVPEDTPKEYLGTWTIHALVAKEGIEAIDELIAGNREYQEDPQKISISLIRQRLIEKATTKDDEPIGKMDFEKMPYKLWQVLVAANERLNGVSDEEARFLLAPSYSKKKQSIQQ